MAVITVEGYNGKKNKAPFVAAALSSMLAMYAGRKVLAIELIDKDIDTIERIVRGIGQDEAFVDNMEIRLAEDGIDQLLREADVQKLMKADFDRYVTPVLKLENRFDIAGVTKNDAFTESLDNKLDALKAVIVYAKEVYEDIVILLPTGKKELLDKIHSLTIESYNSKDAEKASYTDLIDRRIYCIKQGFPKKYDVDNKNVLYLCTNYDAESKFNISDIQKDYCGQMKSAMGLKKNVSCLKLVRSVYAEDAAIEGSLIAFARQNREANIEDVNCNWTLDMQNIVSWCMGEKIEKVAYDWENAEFYSHPERTFEEYPEDTYVDESVRNATREDVPYRNNFELDDETLRQLQEEADKIADEVKEETVSVKNDEADKSKGSTPVQSVRDLLDENGEYSRPITIDEILGTKTEEKAEEKQVSEETSNETVPEEATEEKPIDINSIMKDLGIEPSETVKEAEEEPETTPADKQPSENVVDDAESAEQEAQRRKREMLAARLKMMEGK